MYAIRSYYGLARIEMELVVGMRECSADRHLAEALIQRQRISRGRRDAVLRREGQPLARIREERRLLAGIDRRVAIRRRDLPDLGIEIGIAEIEPEAIEEGEGRVDLDTPHPRLADILDAVDADRGTRRRRAARFRAGRNEHSYNFV